MPTNGPDSDPNYNSTNTIRSLTSINRSRPLQRESSNSSIYDSLVNQSQTTPTFSKRTVGVSSPQRIMSNHMNNNNNNNNNHILGRGDYMAQAAATIAQRQHVNAKLQSHNLSSHFINNPNFTYNSISQPISPAGISPASSVSNLSTISDSGVPAHNTHNLHGQNLQTNFIGFGNTNSQHGTFTSRLSSNISSGPSNHGLNNAHRDQHRDSYRRFPLRSPATFTPRTHELQDDIGAFQDRMKEVFDYYKRPKRVWSAVFYILVTCFIISLIILISEILRRSSSGLIKSPYDLFSLLFCHKFFLLISTILVILLICRQHEKALSTDIIERRVNECLRNFSMGCNDHGFLKINDISAGRSAGDGGHVKMH